MAYFDLRTFINENNLGAYAKLEGQKRDVDGDGDIDSDDYMAAKDQAIKKATKNEAVGGEMAEMLGAFLALVGAGKTALEAVKILGDEHGDISISSIKDAIKQYKASKDMSEDLDEKYDREDGDGHLGTNTDDDFEREQLAQLAARNEDLSADQEDKFHTKLDKLVHKTFGPSSDEKDMKEEMGMEYEYDDIVGPLMSTIVKMEKWVAQNASDDTEAVQLLQLATNAIENFDNYMAYGTEMNEELSMKDITSGQRSYQQMKPYFIAKVIGLKPETEQKASELVLKKSKAFPGMTQIIKTAKTPEEVENVVFFDGYPDEDQTIRFSGLEYELYQVTPNPKIDRLKEGAEGEWPEKLNSRYSDEYEFRLVKVEPTYKGKPGRAKYEVVDLESGEVKGTQVYTSPDKLKAAATDLIKPQGGTRSTYLGEINLSDAL